MQAVAQVAVLRRVLHVRVESFRTELRRELLGTIRIRKGEEEVHVVRPERIRAAFAQLVDEPRVPGVVLPLPQFLQVLVDAPRGDQSANDGEYVQPRDAGEAHSVTDPRPTRPRQW